VDEILSTSTTSTKMQELDMDASILLSIFGSSAEVSFESPTESTHKNSHNKGMYYTNIHVILCNKININVQKLWLYTNIQPFSLYSQ